MLQSEDVVVHEWHLTPSVFPLAPASLTILVACIFCVLQTVNSCSNAGAPTNVTSLQACTTITSTNTCAQKKYGADTPRSCGFTGQDILFSFTGFNSWVDLGGGALEVYDESR